MIVSNWRLKMLFGKSNWIELSYFNFSRYLKFLVSRIFRVYSHVGAFILYFNDIDKYPLL